MFLLFYTSTLLVLFTTAFLCGCVYANEKIRKQWSVYYNTDSKPRLYDQEFEDIVFDFDRD
jgi:hypothetical protein